MAEILNPEIEAEQRRARSKNKLADNILTELLTTETYMPWSEAGVELDRSMLERSGIDEGSRFGYRVKDEVIDSVLEKARLAAEKYLAPDNPKRNPYFALEIAGQFLLDRSLLQRAGDTYVDEVLTMSPGDTEQFQRNREAKLEIIINRCILDWDYRPRPELLREAVLTTLKTIARRSPEMALKFYDELKKKNIGAKEIVESDQELMELLTNPMK